MLTPRGEHTPQQPKSPHLLVSASLSAPLWSRTHRGGGDREQTSFTWEELIRLKAGGSKARVLPAILLSLQPVTVAGLNSCATWASFSPNRLSNLAEEIGYEDSRAVSHCVYSRSSSGRRSSSGSTEEEKKEGPDGAVTAAV